MYDVAAGVLLEKVEAHEGAIWGLTLSPDKVCSHFLLLFFILEKLLIFWVNILTLKIFSSMSLSSSMFSLMSSLKKLGHVVNAVKLQQFNYVS